MSQGNKRHAPCILFQVRNRQSRFSGDPIRGFKEIHAQIEAGLINKKSCHPKKTLEKSDIFIVELNRFGVCKQNSVALQLAVLEIHTPHFQQITFCTLPRIARS